jgi:molybdenum cofactor cytidylyltransferase
MVMEVWALVLAAGAGRRFGGRKMLAPYKGVPLIVATCQRISQYMFTGTIVIVGADADPISQLLLGLPNVNTVFNGNWPAGVASSLVAGIAALPETADACLIFLGDMPEIPVSLIGKVVDALEAGATAVLVECAGAPGHPAGVARRAFGLLANIVGDQGGRGTLASCKGGLVLCTNDHGAMFDVDRVQDLP